MENVDYFEVAQKIAAREFEAARRKAAAATIAHNLRYIEQLEAHMDEGGKIGPNNVRDLIDMYRKTVSALQPS